MSGLSRASRLSASTNWCDRRNEESPIALLQEGQALLLMELLVECGALSIRFSHSQPGLDAAATCISATSHQLGVKLNIGKGLNSAKVYLLART